MRQDHGLWCKQPAQILLPLLALLASTTRQDLANQVAYLKEENRVLRERLPKRLVATDKEKWLLKHYERRAAGAFQVTAVVRSCTTK